MVLRIIAQLMIKIEPQRSRDEERYRNEGGNRESVSPGERTPPARPWCRLPELLGNRLISGYAHGYDRDGRRGYIAFERQQLGIQVIGGGSPFRRQKVPARRLACRVNTRNRHSIGEPNRGR
ncbi:hypothetical protein Ahu01nite_033450 [Winogradskya humida]|uniref:Uncharacterized protein n=1 Tax=Winogradskya humida TaxID=113566 RepID=A0ABQ3ZP07_9ACTN|nr:hypothetical protein Ahu01nite_033450 [Actinoplanes humidus]